MQGAFIRDKLGTSYLCIAMTFGTGSFNASAPNGATTPYILGAPARNATEHFLNTIAPTDYYLVLRTLPSPTRTWLSTPRPTHNIGMSYPEPTQRVALARSHDVVVHLHQVTRARLLTTPGR